MLHRACAAALAMALSLADNASAATPATAPADPAAGCFTVGGGYLRARIRGAVDLDLNWKNADMQCEGGPRPSGNGVRVSIGGPARGKGNRIRLVFGVAGVGEGRGGKALRTNVTLLFEGEQRIFATQGDDKCTVDTLTQERVEVIGAKQAVYRVVARGFCVGPATNLTGQERVVVTSFDFAGRVEFSDDDRHAPPLAPAPTASNY